MTIEQFLQQLAAFHLPLEQWGRDAAKSVESLMEEVESGESTLVIKDDQLVRHLDVVVAYVFYIQENNMLLRVRETMQEFLSPPRTRTREYVYPSVAEKMLRHEDPQQAIDRALRGEELKLQGPLQKVYVGSDVQVSDSQSFPGLLTEYKFFRFFVIIQYDDYKPEGYIEDQSAKAHDPKLVHFHWKDA